MGNPHDGDAWQSAGKANRTSCRKIYLGLPPLIHVLSARNPFRALLIGEFCFWYTPDKQKKKSQPPQKPRLIDTKWVGTIMPVSFALSGRHELCVQ